MSRFSVPICFASLWLIFGLQAARAADPQDAKLAEFFAAYLREAFRREPLMATRLGNHDHDKELDDLSPRARADRLAFLKTTLDQLPHKIDAKALSADGRIDYEILAITSSARSG